MIATEKSKAEGEWSAAKGIECGVPHQTIEYDITDEVWGDVPQQRDHREKKGKGYEMLQSQH